MLVLLVASLVAGALLPSRMATVAGATIGLLLWLAVARAAGLGSAARGVGLVAFIAVIGFAVVTVADLPRALAATEAVTGRLFLVTVVARAVSMIGHERRKRQV